MEFVDDLLKYFSDEKSDVIPIVVGSVMGGIIVVVLVSYFIVRARRAKE